MLNPKAASTYLLAQDLLHPKDIVQGQFQIINRSQRHQNMSVLTSDGPSYFLKQGEARTGVGTVEHEANIYTWLKTYISAPEFVHYLPEYVSFEPSLQLLIIEHLDQSRDLRTYHSQRGKFPKSIAADIGQSLGRLHALSMAKITNTETEVLAPIQPWIFSICQPELKVFYKINKAALDLIQMIQKFSEFRVALQRLQQAWQPNTLIHHDIKFENILTYRKNPAIAKHSIKLIDWELAGLGDPLWDVGSVFNAYLSFWIRSMPITGETPPEEFMQLARYPLSKMQGAMIAFWESYCKYRELDLTHQSHHLIKATQFAAVRLLQTAFERVMATGKMNNNVICLLQLSLNLMKYPQAGITSLFGISLEAIA